MLGTWFSSHSTASVGYSGIALMTSVWKRCRSKDVSSTSRRNSSRVPHSSSSRTSLRDSCFVYFTGAPIPLLVRV